MRFCPKCGKKGIKGDFCSECAKKNLDLGFKDISVKKCISCGRIKVKNQWKSFQDPSIGIVRAAQEKIINPRKVLLHIDPVYRSLKDKPGLKQDIHLAITADHEEFRIPSTIEFTYCPKCSKAGSQYYEGTLQLRNVTQDVLRFVKDYIAKHEKDGLHITKESGRGKDRDLRLTSAKHLRKLGKRLKQKFNGELKETSKLFSRDKQTSKEIHRPTALFRMRGYKIGDIIESKGRKVRIKSIGKRVGGTDIETGKKVFVEPK